MNRRPRRSIDAIDVIGMPRSIGPACRIGHPVACRRGGAPEPGPPARRPPSRAMP